MGGEKLQKDGPHQKEAESQRDRIAVNELPGRLGFFETKELGSVRRRLTEAMASNDAEKVEGLIDDYYSIGEKFVNQRQSDNDDYPRAQIGLLVAIGLIRRDAGRIEDYIDDLAEALDCAANLNYDDIVLFLEQARIEAEESLS